jgi:hypothetical protein
LVVASVDWKSKAVSNKPFRTLRLDRIKSKMPFTFQLIVGSKQLHQRTPQRFLVDVWFTNAISNHGPNQHESSCASLLAVRVKSLKSNKAHTISPSLSIKFHGKSILEEAQFAPTIFKAFEFIVASTSIADFQLIVDLFLNPYLEGVEYIRTIICNKLWELIVEYFYSSIYEQAQISK